ncbi:MAG: family 43 glycosylhydrolase [Lachnospiraceae bacterium]|nr:family 43 glycosylhydrolase [Lachnospiraceae bacterium]
MKKGILFLFLASCLVSAVGCAGQGAAPGLAVTPPADETLQNNPEEKEEPTITGQGALSENDRIKEEYKSVPYRLFPTSKDAWVGDVMPMSDGKQLHLYYLYDTDHNGVGYHPIHKFSTTNFYEYSDDGLVLPYGSSRDDADLAIGTGSVFVAQDGRYHLFYTGHNDMFPEKGLDKECVMHAVSDDNVNWEKIPEDTFYAAENYSGDDFRDPFVFWNEEEACYWLLIAARKETLGGVIARYTSTDLSNWTLCEPLYAPGKQYMLECPDLFQMGDKYYLFYSWDCVTYYAMADSIYGPFYEPEDNVLDGTGFCFYAAKTAELNGKRYLCGWIGRRPKEKDTGNYDWAGNLLIHELVQKEDGTLGVTMVSSLSEYFDKGETPKKKAVLGEVHEIADGYQLSAQKDEVALVDFGIRKASLLLECDISFDGEGYAGFAFGEGEDYAKYTGLVLDAKNNCIHYEGCVLSRMAYIEPLIQTAFSFEAGKEYHIRLVMENEIVVLYIDDTKALSNRIQKSVDGAHLALFANNTQAEIKNIVLKLPAQN